ncbi:MAG: V4R domain-containing protein [Candidatus Aminicenantia bacterium]
MKLTTVKVPERIEPLFKKAQEFVSQYFENRKEDSTKGTITIGNERYILIRAESMSVCFFEFIKNIYPGFEEEEANEIAMSILFDLSHSIGLNDAKAFHKKMKVEDSIAKLSAGPIHFSYTGWAFVEIFEESNPSPDENYYLIYDHPYSFEADSWIKAGKYPDFPVCFMNAGYSSGWCEASFGIELTAKEILCRAKGDKVCRFIMASPDKIERYIREYKEKNPDLFK